MIRNFSDFISYINEGLIKTYDINKTTIDINRRLNLHDIKHIVTISNNNTFDIKLFEFNKIDSSIIETVVNLIIDTLINLYGWFPSKMSMINIHGMMNNKKFNKLELLETKLYIAEVSITFESKFDTVTEDIPDRLYHLSIQEYKDKILNIGITPKRKSKLTLHDYDGRIYICDNLDSCKSLINDMKMYYSKELYNTSFNKEYKKNTKWIIFEIDNSCAKIDKMYKVPNFIGGYYVLNNISKDCIKMIEEEK
jgi:hypothetical protein